MMTIVKQAAIIFTFSFLLYNPKGAYANPTIKPPLLIAHAGGIIDGKTYTNSLQALNLNYNKGHRFFEIDFSWTSDGELVAIHDWGSSFRSKFIVPPEIQNIPTKSQFLSLRSKIELTQLSMEDVIDWCMKKNDAYIITDIKNNNLQALNKIANNEAFKKIVIPQIYNYDEYEPTIKLGFDKIILTIYNMKKIIRSEVVEFAVNNKPFAVTMPLSFAQSGLASLLKDKGIVVYAHTINEPNLFKSLQEAGVYGVYTDSLTDSVAN